MHTKSQIRQKCKKIKIVITDVDGVLTDGGRYYSVKGENLKKFDTRDGMGVNLLLRNDIKTIILTKEKSKITRRWAKEMNISYVYDGSIKKESALPKICKRFNLLPENLAFIGDDVNDLAIFKKVGFSATPNNAIEQAKKLADYICKAKGGEGSFREIADLILHTKFPDRIKWY